MKQTLLTMVIGLSMVCQATTWYVSAETGSDTNSGTSSSEPRLTIQSAIKSASDGDTILVGDGVYAPIDVYIDANTLRRNLTIKSVNGSASTVIEGAGTMYSARLGYDFSGPCKLIGFTLRNGNGVERGILVRCKITHQVNASYSGSAVFDWCTLRDCVIYGCTGSWLMSQARQYGDLDATAYNCTFYNNQGYLGGSYRNCIIYDSGSSEGTYSIFSNCYRSDPGFIDPENGDYQLTQESPCIDAGDISYVSSDIDFAGNPRVQNGTVDIGAYEYGVKQETTINGATWSYVFSSGKVSICGVETENESVMVPAMIEGYAVNAIETNAFQNAFNVVEMTIPADVSIADKALAGCTSLKTVNFEGLPSTTVVPGFYYAKFENLTNWLDSTVSIVDNATAITNSADMMACSYRDEYVMYKYAAYMHFEGNEQYEFVCKYDNYATIQLDGNILLEGGFDAARTNQVEYSQSGWHWIELRGWNHVGAGGTDSGKHEGVKWRKVGETEWRLFADPGDGSLFRAKMGNLSDILAGTAVESVSFGEGVTAIPDGYFVGVSGLKAIALPDLLESLGNNDLRFIGNNAGESGQWVQKDWLLGYIGMTGNAVVLPNAVTNIAPFAFEGQAGLTRIVLPDVVESIGTNAFLGCEGLVSVYAAKDEMSNVIALLTTSGITNAAEIVKAKEVSAPVITPVSGTVIGSSQTISMSCATEGANIYYTLDGTTPSGESNPYKRFRISGKITIQAVAILDGVITSAVTRSEYALGTCEDPVISLKDGTVFQHSDQEVSISCGEEGTLRYTLDGMEPTAESPEYTGPFTISESTVVKAKVFSDSYFDSQVVTANLTREWVQVETPVITAASSFTGSKTKVTISCGTEGAVIRYTTNGNDPNSHSTKYTGPFYVTDSCTVKAYAVLSDWTNSEIGSAAITKVWGIGDTLGKPDHAFATSGDAGFTRVTDETAALGESMKSGAIGNEQKSVLSTTIMGPGTLTFKWKTSCEYDEEEHAWDHAEFAVDGNVITNMDGITDWVAMSYHIDGEGAHTVTWTYVKDDVESQGQDCLWVSDYGWATELTHTETTDVPVPYGWLLAKCRGAVDEYQVYENVAKETAANGINTVEACYVAGLDPESSTNTFNSVITMDAAGLPQITWDPDLGDTRTYKTLGAPTVTGPWTDITDVSDADRKAAGYRFFKVSVEMK